MTKLKDPLNNATTLKLVSLNNYSNYSLFAGSILSKFVPTSHTPYF